jgi:hypothetical protein
MVFGKRKNFGRDGAVCKRSETYLEHVIYVEGAARSQTAKLVKRRSKSNEVEAEHSDDETRA